MQIIFEDEDEKYNCRKIYIMDTIIYAEKVSKWFGRGDKKAIKVAELKRIEQGGRIIEEFMQKFRRVARKSEYEGRVLVEEFKRGISGVISITNSSP